MSKPSWSKAPEWAQALAQDGDGKWFWFELNDVEWTGEGFYGHWLTDGRYEEADATDNAWRETLETRP